MEKEKQTLQSKEVTGVPDCSPRDVYKAILRGEVPATKSGRYWVFRYEDVIAYNERQKRRHETG